MTHGMVVAMNIQIRNLTQAEALDLLNRTQDEDLFASDYLNKLAQNPKALIVGAYLSSL